MPAAEVAQRLLLLKQLLPDCDVARMVELQPRWGQLASSCEAQQLCRVAPQEAITTDNAITAKCDSQHKCLVVGPAGITKSKTCRQDVLLVSFPVRCRCLLGGSAFCRPLCLIGMRSWARQGGTPDDVGDPQVAFASSCQLWFQFAGEGCRTATGQGVRPSQLPCVTWG